MKKNEQTQGFVVPLLVLFFVSLLTFSSIFFVFFVEYYSSYGVVQSLLNSNTISSNKVTTSKTLFTPPDVSNTNGNDPYASMNISKPPANAFNIINYGASPSISNNFSAIQNAIDAAQTKGGIVYVPDGNYKIGGTLRITGKITLEGQSRTLSQFIETVHGKDMIDNHADNTVVQNITLNTQAYDGGHAYGTISNNTLLQDATILSGNVPGHFALYYAGPQDHPSPSSPSYDVGNVIRNVVENDQICDDGISWSFQKNGQISNVIQTGSRLALYVDSNVTITNYTYHPGVQAQVCPGSTQGFWITPPSNDITITNFTTYGNGGEISSEIAHHSSNVTINNEVFKKNGYKVIIGDVNNLTIENSNLLGNTLVFTPKRLVSASIINSKVSEIKKNSLKVNTIKITCHGVSPLQC